MKRGYRQLGIWQIPHGGTLLFIRIRFALSQIGWYPQVLNSKFEPRLVFYSFNGRREVLLRPRTAKWGRHERNADRLILGQNKAGVVLDIEDFVVVPLR